MQETGAKGAGSGGVDPWQLDWKVQVTVEAINEDRSVKVVPFLYLSKDASLEAVPFGISLDKEDAEGGEKIQGVKIVQKTLHSD